MSAITQRFYRLFQPLVANIPSSNDVLQKFFCQKFCSISASLARNQSGSENSVVGLEGTSGFRHITSMRSFSTLLPFNKNRFMDNKINVLNNAQSIRNLNFSGQTGNDMEKLCHIDRVHQLHGGPVKKKKRKTKMDGRPHLKGVVLRTLIQKPRKPNSANRKCCKLRLSTGKEVIAFIPGEGHNLQEHNVVLVNGRRCKDLIGVHYRVVRGKYDCAPVVKKTAD